MLWLFLVTLCIAAWGMTDILYKKASDYNDHMSHLKGIVWVSIAMTTIGLILLPFFHTVPSYLRLIRDNLSLTPLGLLYPIALIFGLMGKRHLDASVVSPLENIDGAMAAAILYGYFLFTGNSDITGRIRPLDLAATALIFLGILLLGIQEQKLAKQEAGLAEEKKRHRLGALALLFPLAYNSVDAVSMVAVGLAVTGELTHTISDIDFFFLEALCFFIVGTAVWLYMLLVKKVVYTPFRKRELVRCGAAFGETVGTFTYILAVTSNPILTAPITSSYCLVTVIAARIFLKERLTKRQYIYLMFLLVGIALLGISEIMKS